MKDRVEESAGSCLPHPSSPECGPHTCFPESDLNPHPTPPMAVRSQPQVSGPPLCRLPSLTRVFFSQTKNRTEG